MTALPYQPVPTLSQRKALHADHAKRYADIQALKRAESSARDACCDVTDEPDGMSWPVVIGSCIAGLGMWAAVGYATWWLVGLFTGVK